MKFEDLGGIEKAFEAFKVEALEGAIVKSTKASWAVENGYSVELFKSGRYRVLYNGDIGNQYESTGVILPIPPLSDSDWDEENPYLDNAFKEMEEVFIQWKQDCPFSFN